MTGGVVRRDGLREAVTKLRDKWASPGFRLSLQPPSAFADDLDDVLDAVPDVPPDPPAECHEGVTRRDEYQPCDKLAVAWRLDDEGSPYPVCAFHTRGDRMVPLSSGVLVAAADVRASALEDAADAWKKHLDEHGLLVNSAQWLRDRAVSEREGTT